jgi:hypothetical protein
MIFELIAFSVFIVLFFALLVHNYILASKKRKLLSIIVQLEVDKKILYNKLSELMDAKQAITDVEQTDGFLKFISESRDWAFKYIEDVQAAIDKFSGKVGPELEYLRTYDSLIGVTQLSSFNKISEAYRELLKVMPDDSDTKDQPQG